MKKILALSSASVSFLLLAQSAFADTLCPKDVTGANFSKLCGLTPSLIIGPIITFIFVVAIIASLLFLIWGGFKWLTSGGDKAAVQTARDHIVAAIIGLVVIFLSYFILNLLLRFFLGPSFTLGSFDIPSIQ